MHVRIRLTLSILAFFIISMVLAASHPVQAQNNAPLQRIESDAAQVAQSGQWTSQLATEASGGSYLYSTGNQDEVLTLKFRGAAVEVTYVAGPSLGTFAIEVDGTVLRTVISTANEVAYRQSAKISYLPDELHTLRVYAQGGGDVIAIDSFGIPLMADDSEISATSPRMPAQPTGLTAFPFSKLQIRLLWVDNSTDETQFRIERSPDGATGWTEIGQVGANVVRYDNSSLACNAVYHYRVRAYRASDDSYSGYSNTATGTSATCADTLATMSLSNGVRINSLDDFPTASAYEEFLIPLGRMDTGNYIMGDWDGDGLKTMASYGFSYNFNYTNDRIGPLSTWRSIWVGLPSPPMVAGRFDPSVNHDCIGVIDSAQFPPYGKAFALYFTCDLTPNTAPTLHFQWLSVVLPDSGGFSGTHQFVAGDFDGDGIDTIAIRRGAFIAYTNTSPSQLATGQTYSVAAFDQAQYWGSPGAAYQGGAFLAGNWDATGPDSFGVFYSYSQTPNPQWHFFYRNDLDWNSGVYILQRVAGPIFLPAIVVTW